VTRKEHRRLYDKAYRRIHVRPLLYIHITRTGKQWDWFVGDYNGEDNNRSWRVAWNEGYDDAESALADALEAFLKAERGADSEYPE
jgi:hypothetical protein